MERVDLHAGCRTRSRSALGILLMFNQCLLISISDDGDGAAGASVQVALAHWYKSNAVPAHFPNFSFHDSIFIYFILIPVWLTYSVINSCVCVCVYICVCVCVYTHTHTHTQLVNIQCY